MRIGRWLRFQSQRECCKLAAEDGKRPPDAIIRRQSRLRTGLIRAPARECRSLATSEFAFADHVERFDTLNRPAGRVKRPEALHANPSFDPSMILFNDVVQLENRSTTAAPAEFSSALELLNRSRIRWIPIYVDGSWTRMVWRRNAFWKKRLAAAASRLEESRKSTVSPVESPLYINRSTCQQRKVQEQRPGWLLWYTRTSSLPFL